LRLRANEVDVSQFWLERVTLNSLNFHFFFFTANNDGQNFAVEFSFGLQVPQFVVIQFDCNWSSFATVNDSRELVSVRRRRLAPLPCTLRTSASIVNIDFSLYLKPCYRRPSSR
jgi:hypothetical protein